MKKESKSSGEGVKIEMVWLKKLKTLCLDMSIVSDFKDEQIFRTFYKKELQKTNQEEFRVEKVIKRKGDKLYVK